ncbi:hypothetical protein AB0H71_13820 [Nocardia sp. NPDC050697]|uniref:hypothetical protein n=1 Tax=Nocardia sp. NPDC050697 TaxID=3155158 RepID=UPI0033FC0A0D
MTDEAPLRRCRFDLNLHADSWADVADALLDLANQLDASPLEGDEPRRTVSGGVSSGYALRVQQDSRITAESYRAERDAWRAARKEEQA